MTIDISNNSDYLTGLPRNDPKLKILIDEINKIIQEKLINAAIDLEKQSSILIATGIWLDKWGDRLGFKRPYTPSDSFETFGFDDAGVGFDQAPFYGGVDQNVSIADEPYRQYLIAYGGQLLTDGTLDSLNSILRAAFGKGYYKDNGNMTVDVIIEITLEPIITSMITTTNILPKPCGVKINSIIVNP
jgi:hypothetical protein